MATGLPSRPTVYNFGHGQPIALGDRVLSGDPTGLTMRARMKPLQPGSGTAMPGPAVPAVEFTTAFNPAVGDEPAFFLHTLTSAQSLALTPGRYAFDSAVLQGGAMVSTTPVSILVITESASGWG